jgi:hypothetical protein
MGVLDDAIREHLELKRKHGAPEEELRRQEEEALGPVRREVAPPDEVEVEGDGEPAAEAQEPPAEPVAEPEEPAEPVAEPAEPAPFDAETSLLAEPEPEPFPEDEAAAVSQPAEPAEPEPEAFPQEGAAAIPHAAERAKPAEPEPEPFPEDEAAAVPHAAEPVEPAEPEPEPFPEEGAAAVPQAAEPVEPLPEPEESEEDEEAVFDAPDEAALRRDPRTVPTVDEDGDGADPEDERGHARDVLEDATDFLEETPEHDRLWFEQRPPRDFDFD